MGEGLKRAFAAAKATRSVHDPEQMWRRKRLRELKAEGVPAVDAVRMVNVEQDRRKLERLENSGKP